MSDSNINPSRSPSPEYYEASAEGQRFDPLNLENPSNGAVLKTAQGSKRIQAEFTPLYSKLQVEVEKKFEKKIEELEEQLQSRDRIIAELRQENAELQVDLVREKSVKREALRAQATAEDKLSTLEKTVEGVIEIMSFVKNSSSDAAMSEQGSIPKNILFQGVEMSVNLQTVTSNIITPERREILEARTKRAEQLEKELRVANMTISSLRQALLEQQSSMQERIDDVAVLQQQVEMLENDSAGGDDIGDSFQSEDSCSEASDQTYSPSHDQFEDNDAQVFQQLVETVENDSAGEDDDGDSSLPASSDHTKADKLHEASREIDKPEELEKLMEILEKEMGKEDDDGDSSVSAAHDNNAETNSLGKYDPSSDDKSDDDEESVMPQDEEQQHGDSRILIGDKCRFFVSGSQFLKIDWDKEYRRDDNSRWVCRRCSRRWKSRREVVDHVWIHHYEGYYECPHCSDPPAHFSWRRSVTRHMKSKHPQLINV